MVHCNRPRAALQVRARVPRMANFLGGNRFFRCRVKFKKKISREGQRMDLAARGQPVMGSFHSNGTTPARGGIAPAPDAPSLDSSLVFTGKTTL
jgi:hypothetical protein